MLCYFTLYIVPVVHTGHCNLCTGHTGSGHFGQYSLCIAHTVPIVQPVHTGSAQVAFLFKIHLVSKMPTEMTAILLIAMIEILSKGQGRDVDIDDNDKYGLSVVANYIYIIASNSIRSSCRS